MMIVMVMMMRYMDSLGYHSSRYRQPRRTVILVPFSNASNECRNKYTEHQNKNKCEHHAKQSKLPKKSHVTFLSASYVIPCRFVSYIFYHRFRGWSTDSQNNLPNHVMNERYTTKIRQYALKMNLYLSIGIFYDKILYDKILSSELFLH